VCVITAAAVWIVLTPEPIAEAKKEEPVKRALAYEQAINKPRPASDETDATPVEAESEAISDFETTTSEAPPDAAPAAPEQPAQDAQDMAALPPDEENDVLPMPGTRDAQQWNTDGVEQWDDERRAYDPTDPGAYDAYGQGDPYGASGDDYARQNDFYAQPGDPYREDDPYNPYAPQTMQTPPRDPYGARDYYGAPQGQPWSGQRQGRYGGQQSYGGQDQYGGQGQYGDQDQFSSDQWVQVISSGSPMRATAAEDAPMLFAFPYGRKLKVISNYQGWVEVTDPTSGATGWMQAHALAPSTDPNSYAQQQEYYEEPQEERRGLFRRGGFADMINRALGGGN
jgi:hypothetical protein